MTLFPYVVSNHLYGYDFAKVNIFSNISKYLRDYFQNSLSVSNTLIMQNMFNSG